MGAELSSLASDINGDRNMSHRHINGKYACQETN